MSDDETSDEKTIHVADVSDGVGGEPDADPGAPVELPVVELLTGRGFVTGKSGSGKSNTASVLIENLLSNNFPCLIVDTDGEYYGLKEEFEILHAGADDECDIVVSPEHAEKIATLALDKNVPIILDVSGYLEEDTANELLLEVVKHLFAKEKKLKKPFLLVLEECHEYIPEGGGIDETGKMLIKVGKRGRKHGLGIVGISQRPADVKKDFITQCDWLCWHRLTWDNDTKVVSRILGSEYADAIEDLSDGEAFVMTDWDESIRRIQFHRKETFDAGATPGLDDFERPELKSVGGNLVSELEEISEEQARRESELADLRQELDEKNQRIRELERELEEARDLSRMADQFAQALLQKAEAPYHGGAGRNLSREDDRAGGADSGASAAAEADDGDPETADTGADTRNSGSAGAASEQATDAPSAPASDAASGDAETGDPADTASTSDASTAAIDPVSRSDVVTESAMEFAADVELGTREAVIEELRNRVETLPEMSTEMLRHYRREGVSDPIAAHIDAGGDGDSSLAYGRNRPVREAGLVRHAGRGRYAYAIPDLVREAYANRLDEDEVTRTVAAVEREFVPPGELAVDPSTDGSDRDTESVERPGPIRGELVERARTVLAERTETGTDAPAENGAVTDEAAAEGSEPESVGDEPPAKNDEAPAKNDEAPAKNDEAPAKNDETAAEEDETAPEEDETAAKDGGDAPAAIAAIEAAAAGPSDDGGGLNPLARRLADGRQLPERTTDESRGEGDGSSDDSGEPATVGEATRNGDRSTGS